MKKIISLSIFFFATALSSFAQKDKKKLTVPAAVKQALSAKYPAAKNVRWEKENGNYEANWGGRSGEDHSVQFTPRGNFVERVDAIPVSKVPEEINRYVKKHFHVEGITEAGMLTDASGKTFYEVEVKGKDVIFSKDGKFVKSEG
ncbi:MAG TPA: PepSY-like domain-containing protein [Chitinophagaceae bacterium]|nr:PepSY-like domain-containing protein [Chitinophagaceae bacterium]